MRDFFTRLAERSLGLAPLVQPRITSRYAEGPSLAADLEESAVREATSTLLNPSSDRERPDRGELSSRTEPSLVRSDSPAREEFLGTPSVASNAELLRSDGATEQSSLSGPELAPHPTLPLPSSWDTILAGESGLEESSRPEMDEVPEHSPSHSLRPSAQDRQLHPSPVRHAVEIHPVRGQQMIQPAQAPSGETDRLPAANRGEKRQIVESTTIADYPHESAISPRPIRGEQPSHRRRPAQPEATLPGISETSPLPDPATQPRPVIRVSIGRIEVRAVRPPDTRPPSPAPVTRVKPPLSLDEYLRQRSGGER
jgi:hypothetical protein